MNGSLVRDYAGEDCTLGRLTVGALVLETLERPWIADPPHTCGHPDTSCVPAGTYRLVQHNTLKFPHHFALVNPELGIFHQEVPTGQFGRTACLIHTGNWVTDVGGCIIVGRLRRFIGERWMITESDDAYEELMRVLPWSDEHTISIAYAPGISV